MAQPPLHLRRSVLFVPGDDARKITKARGVGADTLVLDLEDAIAPASKAGARRNIIEVLRGESFGATEAAIRINPPGTPFFEEDLAAVCAIGASTVMLPKAQDAHEIGEIARHLGTQTTLLLLVETPLGVARSLDLGAAAPQVGALCFGHADFAREMGLTGTAYTNPAIAHARAAVAISARARGVDPIDCVHLEIHDEQDFRADTAYGLSLGYQGRLCIHPRQVEMAHEAYQPSPEQIEYARRVTEGYARAQAEGSGIFTLDGKMIDAPLVRQQHRLLERARRQP